MFRPPILPSLLVAGTLIAPAASAFDTNCPATITTAQQLAAPQAGWQSFVRDPWGDAGAPPLPTRSGFSHIELYEGPPAALMQLMPHDVPETWTFGKTNPEDRRLFMACAYDDTQLRLLRQLPVSVTRCVAARGGALHCDEVGSH